VSVAPDPNDFLILTTIDAVKTQSTTAAPEKADLID